MTQRCDTSKPTPTPLPFQATKPQEKCQSRTPQRENGRRETSYRTSQRMAGSTGARTITFRRLARGMEPKGTEKGKREQRRKKTHARKCWGRRRNSKKTLPAKTSTGREKKRIRTGYVRNPTRARNGHRTSRCGDGVKNERRITGKIPPMKTE